MKKCLIIACMVLPLSLYAAEEAPIMISQYKNIETHITETLKALISQVLSNHTTPSDCHFVIGDNTCKDYYNLSYTQRYIRTPLDVYCAEKKECCSGDKKQRNKEQYCECRANRLREKSYDLENINANNIWDIRLATNFSSDDYCSKYSDVFIENEQVYDKFFYECKAKTSDVKFCDKLAQTTQNLIDAELKKQASSKAKNNPDKLQVAIAVSLTPTQLYESEYREIINSKEFLSLIEEK